MQKRMIKLKEDIRFRYVLIHKNFGDSSAALVEHAHSHILATPVTPRRVKTELDFAKNHYKFKERCIYCDMIYMELNKDERIFIEDGEFIAITPYASHRPFEIWILPQKHETFFEQNTNQQQLAETIITTMSKVFKLLKNPDYLITLHNGPNTQTAFKRGYWRTINKDYHWHIEIMPRLHSQTSFELGSGFSINPISPEKAAKILREENLNA
jgi:UDPglucose--hexose-1-phosphate uridylyltransferase